MHQEYETISYLEYRQLLIGLNGDTALGNVVQIRAETDFEKIKNFNTYEKRIYNDWKNYRNKMKSNVDTSKRGKEVQDWLMSLFK